MSVEITFIVLIFVELSTVERLGDLIKVWKILEKQNDCFLVTHSFNNYDERFHGEGFLVIYHYASFGTIPESS